MRYDSSGEFGEVQIYDAGVSSNRFASLDAIDSIGWHRVNELYSMTRPRGGPFGLVLLTLAGKGEICIAGQSFAATAGSAVVLPAHRPHSYGAASGTTWEFYWFHFYGPFTEACTEDIAKYAVYQSDVGVQQIEAWFAEYRALSSGGTSRELDQAEWLRRVMGSLLRRAVTRGYSLQDHSLAADMMKKLEQYTDADFSLDRLAMEYHYSKEYLIRIFKKSAGMSPYRYWVLTRLKRACMALRNSGASVEEIAAQLGYCSVSNFSNQFKKYCQMSPSEYRRLHQFGKN